MFTQKYFPKTYTYSVRHTGSYSECKLAWDGIMNWAVKSNINFHESISFGMCHDNPEFVEQCRYDACIGFQSEINASIDGVSYGIIDETKCISFVHNGSYDKLFEIYKEIYSEKNVLQYGILIDQPAIEVYVNSPMDTKEGDLITEIFIPIS